jgi:hypothetical protein
MAAAVAAAWSCGTAPWRAAVWRQSATPLTAKDRQLRGRLAGCLASQPQPHLDDAADLRLEAHVEHSIRLVHHQVRHLHVRVQTCVCMPRSVLSDMPIQHPEKQRACAADTSRWATGFRTLLRLVIFPLEVTSRSIMRPGVHDTISTPRLSSEIWLATPGSTRGQGEVEGGVKGCWVRGAESRAASSRMGAACLWACACCDTLLRLARHVKTTHAAWCFVAWPRSEPPPHLSLRTRPGR